MPMLRTIDRPTSATKRSFLAAASSTCCTRWTWLEKLATITRRGVPAMTRSSTGPMSFSRAVKPGDVGVRRVGQEQVDALLAEPGERAQVGDAVVERQLVHLEVAGVQHEAGGRADRDGERIRDRVVDGDELEPERAELLGCRPP